MPLPFFLERGCRPSIIFSAIPPHLFRTTALTQSIYFSKINNHTRVNYFSKAKLSTAKGLELFKNQNEHKRKQTDYNTMMKATKLPPLSLSRNVKTK